MNYSKEDIHAEVMKFTGGGVDVLYDNVANPKVLPSAFRAIGFGGRLVTAGAHAGPNVTIDFAHLYHKQITIKGRPGYHPPDVPKCFAAAADGKVTAQIERILPLSQAAHAHRLVESAIPGQDRARPDPWLGSPRLLRPGLMPILRSLPSSPMTSGFAREGGRSAEEANHGRST